MEQATDKEKTSKRHIEAQKYLEEFDIETVISEMLNSLLHEKDRHPYVYMIKYLAGLMSDDERREFDLSIPEPYPTARPSVKYPKFNSESECLLKKYLTKDEWTSLRYVKTKYGNNINAMTKLSGNCPNDPIGCVLTDGDCINVYSSVLTPIISDVHHLPVDYLTGGGMKEYQLNTFTHLKHTDISSMPKHLNDKIDRLILSFSRNISEFPFNHFASGINKLSVVESILLKSIAALKTDNFIPQYNVYSLPENKAEVDDVLGYVNYDMDWLLAAGLKQNWPENRKIIATEDKSLVILINFADHLQIYSCREKGKIDIPEMYNTAIEILKQMSLANSFEASKYLGFLTSNIKCIGSGFSILSWVKFDHLDNKTVLNNTGITDIIKGLHFDSYKGFCEGEGEGSISSSANTLYSSQSSRLCFKSDIDFLSNYLYKLCGLSSIDSDTELSQSISFDKQTLPDTDANIKTVYDDCYNDLKYQLSSCGNNINSLFKYYTTYPNNPLGIIMHDSTEYSSFYPLIQSYVLLTQNFNSTATDHIHKPDEPKQMTEINDEDLCKISNVSICLMRNIEGFAYPHVKSNSNKDIEEMIKKAIGTINSKGHFADYYSLTDESTKDQANDIITKNKLTIGHDDNMQSCQMDSDYPSNRGVIQFSRDNLYAVVNDIDHMKFSLVIDEPKENFGSALVSLLKVVNEFSKHIIFSYDMKLGFLTTSPKYLGTGLNIKLMLKLSSVSKEALMKHIEEKGDKMFNAEIVEESSRSNEGSGYMVKISNKATIGMSETELMLYLLQFINEIIELDK